MLLQNIRVPPPTMGVGAGRRGGQGRVGAVWVNCLEMA